MKNWARGLRPRLEAGSRPTADGGRRPIPPHFLRLLLLGAVLGGVGLDLAMIHRAEAAPAPLLNGAFADNNGGASGIQAGDRVTLRFDSSTNAHLVTKDNIDTVLALANSRTWLDGAGNIGRAVWSTTTASNDTLVITLSSSSGAPTIAVGDGCTIAAGTIRDILGINDANDNSTVLTGSFDVDELIVSGAGAAPAFATVNTTGRVVETLTWKASPTPSL